MKKQELKNLVSTQLPLNQRISGGGITINTYCNG